MCDSLLQWALHQHARHAQTHTKQPYSSEVDNHLSSMSIHRERSLCYADEGAKNLSCALDCIQVRRYDNSAEIHFLSNCFFTYTNRNQFDHIIIVRGVIHQYLSSRIKLQIRCLFYDFFKWNLSQQKRRMKFLIDMT